MGPCDLPEAGAGCVSSARLNCTGVVSNDHSYRALLFTQLISVQCLLFTRSVEAKKKADNSVSLVSNGVEFRLGREVSLYIIQHVTLISNKMTKHHGGAMHLDFKPGQTAAYSHANRS